MNDLTVILPCAGSGKRLGLPGPKELFELWPGNRLIDFSLNHIRQFCNQNTGPQETWRIQVVIVIRPGKEAVYEYVKSVLPQCSVSLAWFDEDYEEWPGSIHSAYSFFTENNVVLLPDSYLKLGRKSDYYDNHGQSLLESLLNQLNDFQLTLAVHPSFDPRRIARLGAVFRQKDGRITVFRDKPENEPERYNAYWTAYGFRREIAAELYDFLIRSVRKDRNEQEFQKTSFYPAGSIEVTDYRDLGTWEAIDQFRRINSQLT